ncbi:MAG: hypothetical protein QG660_2241, partial [Pseudomonadota bacterium]|nr:hypothetical protein [Pseudomonadota bacterium]
TLVFEDDITREPVSLGVCIRADADEPLHEVLGLYVLPGQSLTLADHLDRSPGDALPLLWNDFEAAVRARYTTRQDTAFFGTQPTKYIHEMIHALQPRAKAIDVREYLKVFNKSVLLRNIESVDAFVRDYVVEAQSIDRRRARSQIDHFKELNRLLEQVRQQITDLTAISAGYDEIDIFVVRSSTTKALAAFYSANEAVRVLQELDDGMRKNSRQRRLLKVAAKNLAKQIKVAAEARDDALEAWKSKPGANDANTYAQLKASNERTFFSTCRRIERDLSQLAGVVHRLAELKILPGSQRDIKEADRSLSHHTNRLEQGLITGIDGAIGDTVAMLEKVIRPLEASLAPAKERIAVARSKCSALAGQVRNADRNGAPISEDVARVIDRLLDAGIVAEPVCNIVQITDLAWQPAIEAFLKSNRESLVITDGREREAIRLIRRMPERDNPFAAKVVQPHQLKDHRWNDCDDSLVGNLFVSDNQVALAYLRSLVGNMKRVETEEELEQYSRALTADGMLSANFTTSRLRFYSAEKQLFGKRLTYAEKEALRKESIDAIEEEIKANDHLKAIEDAIARTNKLGELSDIRTRTVENVAQALQEQRELNRVDEHISKIDAHEFAPLKADFEKKDAAHQELQRDQQENGQEMAAANTLLRQMFPQRAGLRARRDNAQRVHRELMAGNDIDQAWFERVRGEIDASPFGASHEGRMQTCQNRIDAADRGADAAKAEALFPFQAYLSRNNVSLDAELKRWRLGKAWVTAERMRLVDTELVGRQEDVTQARRAAEEAFRNDVAVRIRESIEKMNKTIADINKTLAACPPFSNGERYSFVVKDVEAHKQIRDYIMNVGQGSERDMFTLDNDGHDKIMQLLDDTSSDKAETNPLDDYRMLFSFDLMISREGKPSIPLSRRLGVGSNGEHRTPFYVIAGAAMAAAYRIDAGKHSTGAGLMLLDEAFHGMDQQNALSAARFLDSIGLQMIMAAPEADHSKLAPSLDTIFEINRFDMDIFVERTSIKEPARILLTSDMPSEHPDLLTRMVEELRAGAA